MALVAGALMAGAAAGGDDGSDLTADPRFVNCGDSPQRYRDAEWDPAKREPFCLSAWRTGGPAASSGGPMSHAKPRDGALIEKFESRCREAAAAPGAQAMAAREACGRLGLLWAEEHGSFNGGGCCTVT